MQREPYAQRDSVRAFLEAVEVEDLAALQIPS